MGENVTLDSVLDAAERLDDETHAQLAEIIARRAAERGRQRLIDAVDESRREYASGQCKAMTAEEIVRAAMK